MKRTAIALAIVAGTSVPALVATVWLFGCCVLPFHRVLHRIAPLCHLAATANPSDQQTSTPAQPERQLTPRFVTELMPRFVAPFVAETHPLITCSCVAHRSFITLGAIRCDQDIGLHALFGTFLI